MRLGAFLALLTIAAAVAAPRASAQSFNIDSNVGIAGPWAGAPADTFGGAAGQAGHWVAVGIGPGATNMRGLDNFATTADLTIDEFSGSGGGNFFDNANLSGNHELLMGDVQIGAGGGLTVVFSQLLNGVYTVITYAGHPQGSNFLTDVSVLNSIDATQTVGGAYTGNTFTLGLSHARHRVQTSNGQIAITLAGNVGLGYFGGVQLVYHGAPAKVMYVDATASGTGQGDSWANACARVQDALLVCEFSEGTAQNVWVANGTYVPSRTNDRNESFTITDGVKVYGGFAGGETQLSQRDPDVNICILSGNIGLPIIGSDNSYHVVDISNAGDTTWIDGFTIRNGWASGAGTNGYGGGLLMSNSSAKVRNCEIINNFALFGGGAWTSNGAPQFQRCDFVTNSSDGPGGGLRAITSASLVAVHNCRFLGNDAATDGGGVSANGQNVWMANSVFSGNLAESNGGAVCGSGVDGDVRLYLCTVANNDAGLAIGGVRAESGADGRVYNCIIWANTDGDPGAVFNAQYGVETPGTVESIHNIIQGTTFGLNGNNGSNPQFIDADGIDNVFGTDDDNLHVGPASPAIDSGHNSQITLDVTDLDGDGIQLESVPVDLDDQPRRVDIPTVSDTGSGIAPIVDRGAYEMQLPACAADVNGDEIVNVADLLAVITAWGPCANCANCPADIAPVVNDCQVNVSDLLAVITAWGACP